MRSYMLRLKLDDHSGICKKYIFYDMDGEKIIIMDRLLLFPIKFLKNKN